MKYLTFLIRPLPGQLRQAGTGRMSEPQRKKTMAILKREKKQNHREEENSVTHKIYCSMTSSQNDIFNYTPHPDPFWA
jgi:hypothetical protein